jgi:hypothetical protein
MPNILTDSRPTAEATRSQYRSSVSKSGQRMSAATSIAMPSITAMKSALSSLKRSTARATSAACPGARPA